MSAKKNPSLDGQRGGEMRRRRPSQKARLSSGLLRSFLSLPRRHKKLHRRREGFSTGFARM
eukprot:4195372-Pyramimonas_sp.AAC.1